MPMTPITTDKQRLEALGVVLQYLGDNPGLAEIYPTGTQFTPVGLDKDRELVEVVVEPPANAERTLVHVPAPGLLGAA
jgi:hypothetical protein